MRRLLLSLVVSLTALAPASALAAWDAPATISSPHTFVSSLRAFGLTGGITVAAWSYQDGIGQAAPVGARYVVRGTSGPFGVEHGLPAGWLDLQGYGRDRLLALASPGDRVQVAFGTTVAIGAPRTLASAPLRGLPEMAVDDHGDAVVAWIQTASHNRRIVRTSTRAAGGSFIAAGTLSGIGRADALAVGVSFRAMVAAYERDGRMVARVKRRGHNWGSPQDLGAAAPLTVNDIAAVVTPGGRVVVAWRHQHRTEGGSAGPSILDVAQQSPTGSRFAHSVRVESDGAGAPSLRATPSGSVAVAYVQHTAAGPVARLRSISTAVGAARDVSAGTGGLTDVTLGLMNTVSWIVPQLGDDSAGIGFVASDGPGAAATPNENVQQIITTTRGVSQPEAIWIARPSGTGPSIPTAQIKTVVRFADDT